MKVLTKKETKNTCAVHVCLKIFRHQAPPPLPGADACQCCRASRSPKFLSFMGLLLRSLTHLTQEGARNPSAAGDTTALAPNLYSAGTSSCWWLYLGGPGAASSVQCFQSRLEITAASRCPFFPQGYVRLVILSM